MSDTICQIFSAYTVPDMLATQSCELMTERHVPRKPVSPPLPDIPPRRAPRAHVARVLALACGLASFLVAGLAQAQTDYPSRTITLLVGSAPGGSNDVFARAIAKGLQQAWGQPVVVENKPAAGGVLANALTAKAPADGYTLVVVSSTFTTGAAIRNNLPYDAIRSFTPVAMLARGPMLITVSPHTPFRNLNELVAYGKQNPGKLNYGTSGVGSINQFATELVAEAANIKLTHVPYKGMNPAVTDLIGGQIDILVASAPSLLSQVRAGKIRALAVSTDGRSAVAPDLPSLDEYGLQRASVDLWWGVLAPAGTPDAVITKLNSGIGQLVRGEEMKSFFLREGAQPVSASPAEFARHLSDEIARWRQVAAAADIQPE